MMNSFEVQKFKFDNHMLIRESVVMQNRQCAFKM